MSEARLFVDIEKRLGAFKLEVRLAAGSEIVVLFGPSGAGKTLTLQAIAGLMSPDAGEIRLGDRTFFRRRRPGPRVSVPARKRGVGYVLQHYALFPHLSALENAAFGLWPRRDRWERAAALLERVRMAHLGSYYPHELSGGQRQRVALARALAVEPEVLLLDEPFSALDAVVRERLQGELADLQRQLGLVVVYVTHSLEEAFAVGHRLAVLRDGQIEQLGPVEEVFRRPATDRAAQILGVRNLFRARVVAATAEGVRLDWEGVALEAPPQPARAEDWVTAYIRPEDVKVIYPDRPLSSAVASNQASGRILDSRLNSAFRTLRVLLANGREIEARFGMHAYAPLRLVPGEEVTVALRREGLVILRTRQ